MAPWIFGVVIMPVAVAMFVLRMLFDPKTEMAGHVGRIAGYLTLTAVTGRCGINTTSDCT